MLAKAFVITLKDNEISEKGAEVCINSNTKVGNEFQSIEKYDATFPDEAAVYMTHHNIEWKYPWEGYELDAKTGLRKQSYPTPNPGARIACAISHYRLWKECGEQGYAYVILEHDAMFQRKVEEEILQNNYQIIGINDPFRSTRRWQQFRNEITENKAFEFDFVRPIPNVDEYYVPQGLAGNSAYIIKPEAARYLIDLVKIHGLWPNDAIMCKQLVKRMGVSTNFYTKIQGLPSTTSR